MPKGLRRRYGQGHLHFVTFSCYRHLPLLGSVRAIPSVDPVHEKRVTSKSFKARATQHIQFLGCRVAIQLPLCVYATPRRPSLAVCSRFR